MAIGGEDNRGVRGARVSTDLFRACGGERADHAFHPWTLATLASIGAILELAAGESAEPLRVSHTMVPVVTVAASLPARASRLYAVAESLAGSDVESLKADPATPTAPARAKSIVIQESRTRFLWRMHQRASPAMTKTPFESPMNRCYQLSWQFDRRASAQRGHFGIPRTQYVKPVPPWRSNEKAPIAAQISKGKRGNRQPAMAYAERHPWSGVSGTR
jgi:hypothetical protein